MEENNVITKYHCGDCGIDFNGNNIEECIYCYGKNIISSEDVDKNINIIPFTKNIEDAIKDYKKKVMFNPLVPLIFKNKNTINSIKKIYIQVFLYNVKVAGNVEFIGGEKSKSNVDKYDVINSVNFDYNNVLLNVSTKINEDTLNYIGDYNFNNIKDTKYSEESDLFLKADIQVSDIAEKSRQSISKHSIGIVRESINHSLKKLRNDNTVINFNNTKELYIPIYLLNVKYKDNNYQYIMNGENGKSKINIVYGRLNIILFSILVFVFVFLISYLIAYFL